MSEHGTAEKTDSLIDNIEAFKKSVQKALRPPLRAKKGLEAMTHAGRLADDAAFSDAVRKLRRADLSCIDLEEQRQILLEQIDTHLDRRKMRRRMMVLGELDRRLSELDQSFEHLTDQPLTISVGSLTVVIDLLKDRAEVRYARQTVTTTEADAKSITTSLESTRRTIRERTVESPRFFERLRQSYQVALTLSGGEEGDRVDLVDLLLPLAMISTPKEARRTKGLESLTPFPRYLLAYQLHRLRGDGCLQRDGLRIDLGTATGDSTSDKANVLFLPDSAGGGQYYLSIRFQSAGTSS